MIRKTQRDKITHANINDLYNKFNYKYTIELKINKLIFYVAKYA